MVGFCKRGCLLNDGDNQRYKNLVDDIRRIELPKIRQLENALMKTKRVAIIGVTLGASALVLGGVIWWKLYEKGWC
tara:strand:- start:8 stop:235 length:228 start_codon:yes stop_codon:yes gene_type:complete